MPQIWDIVTPSNLTRFSREVPIPQTSPVDDFVTDRTVNSFKARIRTITRTLEAAKFRVYNAENYVADRPVSVAITDLTLPPFGQKLLLTEQDLLEKAIANGNADQEVIDAVYDDAETNVRATRGRARLAKGDLLTDGKVTINENGVVGVDADFELATSHKPTAGTLWSAGGATPLTDERAWIQQMVDDGSAPPVVAFTSQSVLTYLMTNAEYRAAYWGGNAGQQINLDPQQVNAVRARYALPPIVVDEAKVNVDGVPTRVLPANRFILVAEGAVEFQWGLTAQALEVAAGRMDPNFTRRDAPGIFTAAYSETEPAARWTSTYACGMPLLLDKAGLVSAQVLA